MLFAGDSIAVEIQPASRQFTKFNELHVERTLEAAAAQFSFSVGGSIGRQFRTQQEVRILVSGVPLLAGHVEFVVRDLDEEGGRVTRVAGRDLTGDIIDCSAIGTPTVWRNADVRQIAGELAGPFKVPISTPHGVGDLIPLFALHDGEEVFFAIERLCRLRNLLAYPDGLGGLVLEQPGGSKRSTLSPDGIVEGVNLKDARRIQNDAERYSLVQVQGQAHGEDNYFGAVASSVLGDARDRGMSRYRPLVVNAEGSVDKVDAYIRAEWEVTVRAARADRLRAQVVGWRRPSGAGVWEINRTVPVRIPSLGIDDDMLVVSTNFHLSGGGTWTELYLARPDAFIPQPEIAPTEQLFTIDDTPGEE